MSVDTRHPSLAEFLPDWTAMRDTYRGERVVKDKGRLYLPATAGQIADGMEKDQPGRNAYDAYKQRAVFPEFVSDAIEASIGMMHQKPPNIELPEVMEPMRESATVYGESLEQLLRRINEQQLVAGRIGLLLDIPSAPMEQPRPYIATYDAENIVNWDDGQREELVRQELNFVSLDESEWVRKGQFQWEWEEKYRVLVLGDPHTNEPDGPYQQGLFSKDQSNFNQRALVMPQIRGTTLESIPFVFINSKDLVSKPDDPPLIGLAKLALAVYRGEADYRQALFMQGQDTLVVIGGTEDEEHRVGANAQLLLPTNGQAYYVGPDSQGIPEMRSALENDRNEAAQRAQRLVDARSKERESGEALQVRMAAQTATLNQTALAGAGGLEQLLRQAATWMGADPDQVVVEPNLDFVADALAGKTLVDYMTARSLGAPLSKRSIHRLMRDKDVTEMEYEDELQEIDTEEPEPAGRGTTEDDEGGGGDFPPQE